MFVREILSNKGRVCVGRCGIDRILLDSNGLYADCYTIYGNIITVKVKKILDTRVR